MSTTTGSVYNTTDGPLVLDDDGHVLGGREHRPGVDLDDPRIRGHIDAGRLIVTPTLDPAGADSDVLASDEPSSEGSTAAPVPTPPKNKSKAGRAATTTTPSED